MEPKTTPALTLPPPATPHLIIQPTYTDQVTGALYVHQDYTQRIDPWAAEAHVGPVKESIALGDVQSWVLYVLTYAAEDATLITWNSKGLKAVLDYHGGTPGRCQWVATHPFLLSPEWLRWAQIGAGQPIQQAKAIELLETVADDIRDPDAASLMDLLRNLRANVRAEAQTEIRPDGTTAVSFQQDKTVRGGASNFELPAYITIAIPVLKGHTDGDGRPVLYELKVRLRASVDDSAHLALRFSLQNTERVLEDVYADRVALAERQLSERFTVLRAAD